MYHEMANLWKNHLKLGLKEDGWPWDWTTLGSCSSKKTAPQVSAKVIAKSPGIWAAQGLTLALNQMAHTIKAQSKLEDGEIFDVGKTLIEFKGNAHEILGFERPFLNLAAYVSGIATTTSRLVNRVKAAYPKNPPRVTLTRKTLPGYRDIAIYGVRVGGGFPHRVALSGGLLIKENHIAVAGGIEKAIRSTQAISPHGLKLEIEVKTLSELKQAIQVGVDGVLLDNFSVKNIQSALKFLKTCIPRPFVEVSGGLTEETIADFALEGVDILSVGLLTHSPKSVDLSFLIDA